ncbi:MAG: hypothetical protein ABR915_06105 [Thermoguttaceae bacterium]
MTKVASFLVAGAVLVGTTCSSSRVRCADKAETPNLQQSLADAQSQDIEKELAQWKPDHEDLSPVLGNIFRPKAEIVGEWTTGAGFASSSLSIRRKESGGHAVDFSTGGCLGQWGLQREGTYTGGVFRLNKPVEEYRPHTYDTLYVVFVNDTEYLISQSAIRFVVKTYSKKGVVAWSGHIKFSGFHRRDGTNNNVSK